MYAKEIISCPAIGVDEAGRGPVFGPMVIAGVYLEEQKWLQEIGVRDSKVLSSRKREELYKRIVKGCQVEIEILIPKQIDSLRERYSLNVIEAKVFSTVVNRLLLVNKLTKNSWIYVIVDAADVRERVFGEEVKRNLKELPGVNISVISKHRADETYPVVSAASIVAKVIRDREISRIKEDYGDIGSGYPADPITRAYLHKLLKSGSELPWFVRQSWETVKKMKKELRITRIEDYL